MLIASRNWRTARNCRQNSSGICPAVERLGCLSFGNDGRQRRGGALDPQPRDQIHVLRPAPHKHRGDFIQVHRRPILAAAKLTQHREQVQSIVTPEWDEVASGEYGVVAG